MFNRTSLLELGLVIQLGHRIGEPCANAQLRKLTVLDTNGLHTVAVRFCDCQLEHPHRRQLMRVRWWPATPSDPQTVFTFNLLREFQYQNLQGHITAYDFYQSLEFLTDGRLSVDTPVRGRVHIHRG